MKNALRWAGSFGTLSVLLAGCITNPGDTQNISQRGMDPAIVHSQAESDAHRESGLQTMKVHQIHRTGYVSLSDVAKGTGYHGAWLNRGRVYALGDTDVVWTVRTGDSRATMAGREVRMQGPAVLENGHLMIPVSGVQALFGSEITMSPGKFGISALPRPVMGETGSDGGALPFTDGDSGNAGGKLTTADAGRGHAEVIAFAKRFMGVRYEFGAGPYASTGRFDCSSFVEYVMKRYGVDLPRTAREQAAMGVAVSRDELVPGDLLFFNVPGRFKSLATPGHVGIYAGGGRMIHCSPAQSDGVQISDLNRPFYMRSFLYAKRVLGS